MSTWHQDRNPSALQALWTPDPTKWKCISDKYGGFASCMTFDDEASARQYAAKTGDIVLPPKTTNQGEKP